ncbi:acyl-CoA thioesterase [Shewanella intestini]|uniref:Acyl-CoA thioesterase n=1 Tax=Shewanella intestini TaxID=2017544 RepID=A0ABS5I4N0_9GAMM|nr:MULTISPECIES: acyl-CoA thioesterase [Shewanella]MBR9728320.1 acyl-CoA thioesterase [Shewanella intestini]MRG35785.1 acyl-CoA thioesterase [Shewanella sp. XMDDZSB0408]
MKLTAEAELSVPFQDCDPMQIVWHGNYFRYLEEGRQALLSKLDFGYNVMKAEGFAYPVIDTRMKYVSAARFQDKLRVIASLEEWENRLKISYRIIRISDGKTCIKAYTTHCAVGIEDGEMRFASPNCLLERVNKCLNQC